MRSGNSSAIFSLRSVADHFSRRSPGKQGLTVHEPVDDLCRGAVNLWVTWGYDVDPLVIHTSGTALTCVNSTHTLCIKEKG
jgi:hypothetical protein